MKPTLIVGHLGRAKRFIKWDLALKRVAPAHSEQVLLTSDRLGSCIRSQLWVSVCWETCTSVHSVPAANGFHPRLRGGSR